MAATTSKDVAKWMLEQVKKEPLYHSDAAKQIHRLFGEHYVHMNIPPDPLTIQQNVLSDFKAMAGTVAVRDSAQRCWRKRKSGDAPGWDQ